MSPSSRVRNESIVQLWRERAVYLLLFLLPIGAVSVRHWVSTTFALLFLLSLPDLFRRPVQLKSPERTLLFIVLALFAVFLLTSLANDQLRDLGREGRFLLFIPIYLMVRNYDRAGLWLLRGSIPAGFVFCAQALYDTRFLHLPRASGIYSPTLFGPLASLNAILLLVLWRIEAERAWLRTAVALSAAASLVALALTVSRGGFLGLLGMLTVWGAFYFRGRYYAAALAAIAVFAVLSYMSSDHVQRGIDAAVTEVVRVVEADEIRDLEGSLGPVPARFEMWYAALLVARDHPIVGIGRGNFPDVVREYVEKGRMHPDVVNYNDPHNAYLDALVSKGIFGLATLLAILLYPLAVLLKTRRDSPDTALVGVLLLVGFGIFSLTDSWTFIKSYFISLFVTYLAVLFSWHLNQCASRRA